MKDTNPFDLKVLAKAPKDYLDTDEFFEFLVKKNISVRKDNLPRFAYTHNIKISKKKREGSGGTVPTIYKVPKKVHFINEIPKNNVGKILRRKLRELKY